MQRKGVSITVYSCYKVNESKIHKKVKEVKEVIYFDRFKFFNQIYAHFFWFFRNPCKYLRLLFFSLKRSNGIFKLYLKYLYEVILIERSNPEHIHAHYGCIASDMSLLVHLLTGIPFTFTSHGVDIFFSPPQNYKIKTKLSKKHITISEYNKNYILTKFRVDENKLAVIHSGIDFSQNFPDPKNREENLIISVARLEHKKGIDNLIKACLRLKGKNINFQCLIVGEGTERLILENLINDYDLTNEVKLLGFMTQDEVFELLSKARIKILPSRSETMGVALMEAIAMRVPVIGPNVLGVPELIEDNVSGFLVNPDDVDTLADKIRILLTNDKLRSSFSEIAYKKITIDFNLKIETDKLLSIWKE
ncbi:MAG: glycosyltransferase family 4 protein [Candidatus Omnitrophica bacterium]|nr:glycosyltransferase family 4 protein [Candidatus Omnitrophota bacterium]